MIRVGLTGGIGSGKTTVARIFEVLGIPVYYADDAAKRIMNEDEDLKQLLIKSFGAGTYDDRGLNRAYLSSIVFNDPAQLTQLNSLVHPATIADADSWLKKQTAPYSIKEAALLFEADARRHLDYVIGVQAPLELRLQRTMQRDHITEEAVRLRMDKQMDEAEKMKRCDVVVHNDEHQLLIPQVMRIHETMLERSG